jgi:hypothetical protein
MFFLAQMGFHQQISGELNHHQKVGGFHPKILGSTQQKSWMQQLLFTLWLFKIAMV